MSQSQEAVSRLEDRLRAAYQSAAGTIAPGTVKDLDDLDILGAWPARPKARRERRVLLPAAAAAAVAGVVILAAVVLPLALGHQPGPATSAAGAPKFLIVNDDYSIQVRNATTGRLTAQVELGHYFTLQGRNATQGNLLPQVKPPAGADSRQPPSGKDVEPVVVTSVTDLDGGHHYVVELHRLNPRRSWLYQFRLSSSGQPSALTPFAPLPTVAGDLGVTFSENGQVLAYAAGCPAPRRGQECLSVMPIATGATRRWVIPPSSVGGWSLNADGSLLEYDFAPHTDQNSSAIAILRTDAAPGDLISRSAVIGAAQFGPAEWISFSALTPDGRSVYFSTYPIDNGHMSFSQLTGQLRVLDLATGRTRIVARNAGQPGLITPDPSVRYLLMQIEGEHRPLTLTRLDLVTGRSVPLPSSWLGPNGSVITW